jgi:hypothetical protein
MPTGILLQAKLDLRRIKLNELLSVVQLYKAPGGEASGNSKIRGLSVYNV